MDVEEVRAQEFLPLRVFTVLNFIYFLKKFLAAIGYLFGGNARLSAAVSAFLFKFRISADLISTRSHHTPLDFTRYAARAREAIDLINESNTHTPVNFPIPKVVLLGEQGSGKSSLIEILTQIPLPRSIDDSKGTRCPIEIHLSRGDEWRCSVSLRNIQDRSQDFDETTNKDTVPTLLSRAQLAAFNLTNEHHRLNVEDPDGYILPLGSVSRNVVEVRITGAGVDAIFVDLPGPSLVPPHEFVANLSRMIARLKRMILGC